MSFIKGNLLDNQITKDHVRAKTTSIQTCSQTTYTNSSHITSVSMQEELETIPFSGDRLRSSQLRVSDKIIRAFKDESSHGVIGSGRLRTSLHSVKIHSEVASDDDSGCFSSEAGDFLSEGSPDWSGFLNCISIMVMLSQPSPPAIGAKHRSSTFSHTNESLLSCMRKCSVQSEKINRNIKLGLIVEFHMPFRLLKLIHHFSNFCNFHTIQVFRLDKINSRISIQL